MYSRNSRNIKLAIALFFLLPFDMAFAVSNSPKNLKWHPPKVGLVRDSRTAISIARLVWFSSSPELKRSTDETWQSNMVAVRKNGTWIITQKKMSSTSFGGGLEIDISSYDGKVIGIFLVQ